jgi:2,3-bisphosphoglycerate-dependent phosphoglycerate mutase
MQLYLIRHAQSTNNIIYDNTGADIGRSDDPELTGLGRNQAQSVARFIAKQMNDGKNSEQSYCQTKKDLHLTYLYTSLMIRALNTASQISTETGLSLQAWPDFHENGGIYFEDLDQKQRIGQPGKPRAYFEENFPWLVLPVDLNHEGWWNRPYEPPQNRRPRAERVLKELLLRYGNSEDQVAIVTHGGFANTLIREILQIPEDYKVWFVLNNVSITRIDIQDGAYRIVYMNRVDFLPEDMIS